MACLQEPCYMKPKKDRLGKRGLEEAVKEKVTPLLEESMEKNWGITIPKLETDITDKLANPYLNIYVPLQMPFLKAKKKFKKEFLKRELQLHLGNISQLAKLLEMDRRSIHRAIKNLDIDIEQLRGARQNREEYKETLVDQTIRSTLEQYKEIIAPRKMEQMYQEVPRLSRNIAKFLPSPETTWKEAEEEFERQFLYHALEQEKGNVAKAAGKIGLRAETLHRKIKKLGIQKINKQ